MKADETKLKLNFKQSESPKVRPFHELVLNQDNNDDHEALIGDVVI